jgi:hypothetical protein
MSQDINLTFCTAQNVFSAGAVVESTDWIDMKAVQDNAAGDEPTVEIIVTTSFVGGNFVQFVARTCDAAGSTGAGVAVGLTDAIAVASLIAASAGTPTGPGYVITLRLSSLPALPAAGQVGIRLQVSSNGTTTAGAISAQLLPEAATNRVRKAYGSGY